MKLKMILNVFPLMMVFLVLFACQKDYESVVDPTSKTVMTSSSTDLRLDQCILPTTCGAHDPCPDTYDPVCGCNGMTYLNACEAGCAGVQCYTKGPCCVANSRIRCICPQYYDPVCGCDGVTYNNSCEALCVGIRRYTQGPCGGGNTH